MTDDELWQSRCNTARDEILRLSSRLAREHGGYPVVAALLACAVRTAKDNGVEPDWLDDMLAVVAGRAVHRSENR